MLEVDNQRWLERVYGAVSTRHFLTRYKEPWLWSNPADLRGSPKSEDD